MLSLMPPAIYCPTVEVMSEKNEIYRRSPVNSKFLTKKGHYVNFPALSAVIRVLNYLDSATICRLPQLSSKASIHCQSPAKDPLLDKTSPPRSSCPNRAP